MDKLVVITIALCISFVLSVKNNEEALDHNGISITSLQNFCYNETGFTKEQHKLIRDTRAYSSNMNYFCYVGCYCTHFKDLLLFTRVLNYGSVMASITRSNSISKANQVMNQCKKITTNSLCAAGREIHDCFAQNGVAIEGLIGYFDGGKM
ncbi:uncharacterized protein LOC106644979 [Copidosoma floridanum]|uniref:uncharacterized protein LOC106644979 n=1 Tax=Copidosoma floridanum TaxID=29053 RepID=UPI0006C9CA23|nr:uncharacterized protein LOC106644979 [Copidosoma floridanum]